jgi:hypothetical protein
MIVVVGGRAIVTDVTKAMWIDTMTVAVLEATFKTCTCVYKIDVVNTVKNLLK